MTESRPTGDQVATLDKLTRSENRGLRYALGSPPIANSKFLRTFTGYATPNSYLRAWERVGRSPDLCSEPITLEEAAIYVTTPAEEEKSVTNRPKVYLAGPNVFRLDAKEHGEELKEKCSLAGFEGLFPADSEVDGNLSRSDQARMIYAANISLIREADQVIANLTPFRGPSMDVGTAFEIGYATALGKPVVGYTEDPSEYVERVPHNFDTECNVQIGIDGMIVEDFGFCENLMIIIAADDIAANFDDALQIAKERKH